MSPKEKAKELVKSYRGLAHSDFHNQTGYDESQREQNQIQCALIAVDEILLAITYADYGLDYLNQVSYWEEVKQEIEKL